MRAIRVVAPIYAGVALLGILLMLGAVFLPVSAFPLSIQVYVQNATVQPPSLTVPIYDKDTYSKDEIPVVKWMVGGQMPASTTLRIDQGGGDPKDQSAFGSQVCGYNGAPYTGGYTMLVGSGTYCYSFSLDRFQLLGAGPHTVTVTVTFSNANALTQTATYTLKATEHVLVVDWLSPKNGDTVHGTIPIHVQATRITDVPTSALLLVDDAIPPISGDSGPAPDLTFKRFPEWAPTSAYTWEGTWDTTAVSDGEHTLSIKFTYADGQFITISIVTMKQSTVIWSPFESIGRVMMFMAGIIMSGFGGYGLVTSSRRKM